MDVFNNCEIRRNTNNSFSIDSSAKTDYFIDKLTNISKANAPYYFETVDFNFEIRAGIRPYFQSVYDAGAILILDDDEHWIKAGFEYTDLGYHSIVSVVTNGASDDCNGERVDSNKIHIRVLRINDFFSIHYSLDGQTWKMNRYFRLAIKKTIKIGVIAQSPTGNGVTVDFSDFVISENKYNDLRSGK
jgi:regulation of enolase protein 1 (concanavalin A-like superfamily)